MKKIRWALVLLALAVAASLPWIFNACGGSSGGGETTTHTMTLKGATS